MKARQLVNEAKERWALYNEINRTKRKMQVDGMDEHRKRIQLRKFEDSVMQDDISVVVGFLNQ